MTLDTLAPNPQPTAHKTLDLLLVEDNPDDLELLSLALERRQQRAGDRGERIPDLVCDSGGELAEKMGKLVRHPDGLEILGLLNVPGCWNEPMINIT